MLIKTNVLAVKHVKDAVQPEL